MNNNNHHSLLTADLHEAESVDDLQVDTSKNDPASQSTHDVYKTTTTNQLQRLPSVPRPGKYREELKHMLPFRLEKGQTRSMPIDYSGCFSFLYFSWMTPIIWKAYRKGLTINDMYLCSPYDASRTVGARLGAIWEDETLMTGLHNAQLDSALFRFVKTRLAVSVVMYIIALTLGFIGATHFAKGLLDFLDNDEMALHDGIGWMFGLLFCELGRLTFTAIMYAVAVRTALRTHSALHSLIYRKIMRSTSSVVQNSEEINNMFTKDLTKVFQMLYSFPLVLGGPLYTLAAIIFTAWLLHSFCLVNLAIFTLSFLAQFWAAKFAEMSYKEYVSATEQRISLIDQMIGLIKFVKIYAWENPFLTKVSEMRQKEKGHLQRFQYLRCLNTSLTLLTPLAATILTILFMTLAGNPIAVSEAFTLVIVNYTVSNALRMLPISLEDFIAGKNALQSIEKLLRGDELENYLVLPNHGNNSIEMMRATVAWDSNQVSRPSTLTSSSTNFIAQADQSLMHHEKLSPVGVMGTNRAIALHDLCVKIPKGRFIGVAGSEGCGKSAFLNTLMGQMRLVSGKVAIRGTIAYVPQTPWIEGTTVRRNIIFEYPFHPKRYYEAIFYCGLTDDIAEFPDGEQTAIGEGGHEISDAQRHKIALARAYYADRDVYLLDEPFTFLGEELTTKIITNLRTALRSKTFILATRNYKLLEQMDQVILLKEGRIRMIGTHEDLLAAEDSDYRLFVESSKNHLKKIRTLERLSESRPASRRDDFRISTSIPTDAGDDVIDELSPLSQSRPLMSGSMGTLSSVVSIEDPIERSHAIEQQDTPTKIHLTTYKYYMAAGGGLMLAMFVTNWFFIGAFMINFSHWWLAHWISQGSGNYSLTLNEDQLGNIEFYEAKRNIIDNPDLGHYQLIYGLSFIFSTIPALISAFLLTKFTTRAVSFLQALTAERIARSPLWLVNMLPVSRFLSLFTKHLHTADAQIPCKVDAFLQRAAIICSNLVILMCIYKWFFAPFIFGLVVFAIVFKMYKVVNRELKRIELLLRAPIYSLIRETREGLSTIRAFNKQEEYHRRLTDLTDEHSSPLLLYFCASRWLSTRLDVISLFITILVAAFAVVDKGYVSASYAGLALALAMQMNGLLQVLVRLACEIEGDFFSLEKIKFYDEILIEERNTLASSAEPPIGWPNEGHISMNDLILSYKHGTIPALQRFSLDIGPREKVAIVGKPGAGKTSLVNCLIRLVDLSSGSILIDGIDIKSVRLELLRAKVSVITPEAVLFPGTIRYNLNPLREQSEERLLQVLETLNIKEKIMKLRGGLDYVFKGDEDHFITKNDRQLICLGRALLKKSAILVLDEAMASINAETEARMYNLINTAFSQCTIIAIIPHRFQWLTHFNRVIVMDQGKVIEEGPPHLLLSDPETHLSKIINIS